jgi:hypothetical protein
VSRQRLRPLSGGIILVCVGLAVYGLIARPNLAPHLNADYSGLYNAGRLLNNHGPERLYDFQLHADLYHELLPQHSVGYQLPYLHPPHVAFALRPLAQLPYPVSYAVWLTVSAALYLGGLIVLLRTLPWAFVGQRLDVFLLALSFEPFIVETWLNGQLAAVGFLSLCLALAALERGRPLAGGLALSVCLYKPPLLVVIVPLLVIGRSFRVLTGFSLGAVGWLGVNVALVGIEGCKSYLAAMRQMRESVDSGLLPVPYWKYVDLNSFVGLWPLPAGWRGPLALALAAAPALLLAAAWWRYGRSGGATRRLLWAAALAWSPVLNLYTPMYDTLGVVAVTLLLISVTSPPEPPPGLRWILVLLYLVPWVAPATALQTGLQPYTLVLAALGGYTLWRLRRETRPVTA